MLNEIDASYLLGTIINPLSSYYLCNHFIASEITPVMIMSQHPILTVWYK